MMNCKKVLLICASLLVGEFAHAQYLRTSYFMEGTSSCLQLNPGLQPMRGYFNFPVAGSFNVGASSNVLGTEDIIDILDSGSNLFTNDALYSRLKTDNRLNVNLNTDILSFGWYKGKNFWTFNVGLRTDIGASIPKNMFDYLRNADQLSTTNLKGEISNMTLDVNAYAEVGLGYSRAINDRLTVGGRVKVLLGLANAQLDVDQFSVDMNLPENPENPDSWNAGQQYHANVASHAHVTTTMKGGGLSFSQDGNKIDGFDFDFDNFGIAGKGFGIDLGASYKLFDNVTLSAAVLDLGFLKWDASCTTVATSDQDEQITIDQNNYTEYVDGDFLSLERFNLTKDEEAVSDRKVKLASTVLLAGEYALFNNKLSVGAMYTARFVQPKTLNELTFSATFRPKNWFNAAVSYSPIQASGKSLGVALKFGPLFVGTDYMFFGSNSKTVNGFVGISFPLGKKRSETI